VPAIQNQLTAGGSLSSGNKVAGMGVAHTDKVEPRQSDGAELGVKRVGTDKPPEALSIVVSFSAGQMHTQVKARSGLKRQVLTAEAADIVEAGEQMVGHDDAPHSTPQDQWSAAKN
jgi:hypothetical protein